MTAPGREGAGASVKVALAVLLAALLASGLFVLCYRYDNKYTARGPQAHSGVLTLTDAALDQYPRVFLIWDWAIYRDALLTPAAFAESGPEADEYTFIGQYMGFEGRDRDRSPHGSATYRLRIELPRDERSYTLELPEIYSAYRLYINGALVGQMGQPEPERFEAQTGIRSVTVQARDSLEILIAVSDFGYLYSGMLYPPAFGTPEAVSAYMNTRLSLRVAAMAVALCIGLLALCIRAMLGRLRGGVPDGGLLLYGLLCLCFVGTIGYPVVKTLFPGGLGWYYVENFCRVAMLALIALIQRRVSGLGGRAAKVYLALALFVCGFCLLAPVLTAGNLPLMLAYSGLLEVYTYASAAFLTVSTAWGVIHRTVHSTWLLCGAVVFDCGLIWGRIYSGHEPILLGWFSEIASGLFVALIGVVMAAEVARQYRERLIYQQQAEGTAKVIRMQNAYYPVLLEKEHALKTARHDLRHHFVMLRQLAEEHNFGGLVEYIDRASGSALEAIPFSFCEHYAIDMLLRLYAGLMEQKGIALDARVDVPAALAVSDVDLCVILSNLLENAVEAAAAAAERDRWAKLRIRRVASRLSITLDNGFDGVVLGQGGQRLSKKGRHRVGLGLSSVEAVARKYGGHADFYADEARPVFHSQVMLALSPPINPEER